MIDRNTIEFIQTCRSCPEQYDAMYEGEIVGHLQLRWDTFWVFYPDVYGQVIYTKSVPSGLDGFETEEDRQEQLGHARRAIARRIEQAQSGQPDAS